MNVRAYKFKVCRLNDSREASVVHMARPNGYKNTLDIVDIRYNRGELGKQLYFRNYTIIIRSRCL